MCVLHILHKAHEATSTSSLLIIILRPSTVQPPHLIWWLAHWAPQNTHFYCHNSWNYCFFLEYVGRRCTTCTTSCSPAWWCRAWRSWCSACRRTRARRSLSGSQSSWRSGTTTYRNNILASFILPSFLLLSLSPSPLHTYSFIPVSFSFSRHNFLLKRMNEEHSGNLCKSVSPISVNYKLVTIIFEFGNF